MLRLGRQHAGKRDRHRLATSQLNAGLRPKELVTAITPTGRIAALDIHWDDFTSLLRVGFTSPGTPGHSSIPRHYFGLHTPHLPIISAGLGYRFPVFFAARDPHLELNSYELNATSRDGVSDITRGALGRSQGDTARH